MPPGFRRRRTRGRTSAPPGRTSCSWSSRSPERRPGTWRSVRPERLLAGAGRVGLAVLRGVLHGRDLGLADAAAGDGEVRFGVGHELVSVLALRDVLRAVPPAVALPR